MKISHSIAEKMLNIRI